MSRSEQPTAQPSSAGPPGARGRGWLVGILGLVVLAYITLNTLRTEGPGSTGPTPGERLPPFAAPLASSDLEGDANVAEGAGDEQAGPVPACEVDDPRALNICTLAREGPVVLAFVTSRSETCLRELDVMERISRTLPGVRFAAVGIKGDRADLRRLAARRGWTFPLAHDRDGAVANRYGVAVCPTVVLARRGGEVVETVLGADRGGAAALAARARRLEQG